MTRQIAEAMEIQISNKGIHIDTNNQIFPIVLVNLKSEYFVARQRFFEPHQ